jgi:5-methylcytosine-specific restriction endonuclease McrA
VAKPFDAFGRLSDAKDGLTYACLDCTRAKMKAWRAANGDRDRAAKNRWAEENRDKIKEKSQRYYAKNREKHKSACDKWAKANPQSVLIRQAKRRASKRNAMPIWLTAIQIAQIQEMYDVAIAKSVQTGIDHHVDHIHPLQGKGFNGLHVPWNLRVIPAHENQVKSNNLPAEEMHLAWGVQQ